MNNLEERQYVLEDAVKQLEAVNKKMAKLTLEKEALTQTIIAALGHQKEGQRSYNVDCWKVTVKTPFIYSLDTKAYKNGDVYLPDEFDPIKETETFTVDKKLFDKYYNSAPDWVRKSLVQLVTVKPGKASIVLGTL